MDPLAWAAALEASGVGDWMRSSPLAYPVVNLVHLLGLTLLIGPMLLLDLRLLGAGRRFDADAVSEALTPWAVTGLLLLLPSGALLFAADAGPLATNTLMLAKLALIAAGIVNALLFRALWRGRLVDWDFDPPGFGRLQALASLACWLGVGALGRLVAYG